MCLVVLCTFTFDCKAAELKKRPNVIDSYLQHPESGREREQHTTRTTIPTPLNNSKFCRRSWRGCALCTPPPSLLQPLHLPRPVHVPSRRSSRKAAAENCCDSWRALRHSGDERPHDSQRGGGTTTTKKKSEDERVKK